MAIKTTYSLALVLLVITAFGVLVAVLGPASSLACRNVTVLSNEIAKHANDAVACSTTKLSSLHKPKFTFFALCVNAQKLQETNIGNNRQSPTKRPALKEQPTPCVQGYSTDKGHRRVKRGNSMATTRPDGRRPDEHRPVKYDFGSIADVTGSCQYACGSTLVAAAFTGPSPSKSRLELVDRAYLEVDVKPFCAPPSFRQAFLNKFLHDVFAGKLLMTTAAPRAALSLTINPVDLHGGLWASAFNASMAAVLHAGFPLKTVFVACSAAIIESTVFIDPSEAEESLLPAANADMKGCSLHTCIFDQDGAVQANQSVGQFTLEQVQQVHEALRPVALRMHAEMLRACESFLPPILPRSEKK